MNAICCNCQEKHKAYKDFDGVWYLEDHFPSFNPGLLCSGSHEEPQCLVEDFKVSADGSGAASEE